MSKNLFQIQTFEVNPVLAFDREQGVDFYTFKLVDSSSSEVIWTVDKTIDDLNFPDSPEYLVFDSKDQNPLSVSTPYTIFAEAKSSTGEVLKQAQASLIVFPENVTQSFKDLEDNIEKEKIGSLSDAFVNFVDNLTMLETFAGGWYKGRPVCNALEFS